MAYDTTTSVTDDVTDNLAQYHNELKTAIDHVMSATAYAAYKSATSMTGNVTLTDSDFPIQSYSPTAARDLTMPAVASTNHAFYIVNRSATYVITVKNSGGTTLGTVAVSSSALYFSDGANGWYSVSGGSSGGGGYPCEARLTLSTGVPVPTTELTAQGTLYLTKYNGDKVSVYDGSSWTSLTLGSDLSITLSSLATASKLYDIFAYSNAGVLAIESLVWTSDTARATALTTQNGVYVKSGDATRRYIGTIYIDGSKQCYQSKLHNYVFNLNNPVDFFLQKDVDTPHSYNSATYRYYNNDSTQYVDYVVGIDNFVISASISGQWADVAAGETGYAAIGLDNTTALSPTASFSLDGRDVVPVFINRGGSGVGLHKLTMLEAAVGTVTMGNYTLSAVVKG